MSKPLRVLLVEDNADDAQLVVRELRRGGFEVEDRRVETADALEKALRSRPWDIILADYSLPHFNGVEALKIVHAADPDLPVILISGTLTEDMASVIMRSGARDLILKGNLARLVPAVERELDEAGIRRKRRRAEQALQESEERYRLLVEYSPIAIAVHSEGKVVYANPAALKLMGASKPEQLIGKPVIDFAHPDFRDKIIARIKEVQRTGAAASPAEEKFVRLDGRTIDVETTALPIRFGDKLSMQVIIQDISESKASQDVLLRSEAKYRSLFENFVVGVFRTSPEGRLIEANPAYARMYGYASPEEMKNEVTDIGRQLYADPEQRTDIVRAAVSGEIISGRECQVIRRDGTRFWVGLTDRAIKDDQGAVLYFEGTELDVTERKKAEEALRESESRYRLLAEHIHDVIWLMDIKSGRFLYVSPSVYDLRGYTPEEVMAAPAGEALTPESQKDMAAWIGAEIQDMRQGRVARYSKTHFVEQPRKDETTVWTEVVTDVICDENGEPIQIVGLSRDITERKRQEDRLLQLNRLYRTLQEENELIVRCRDRQTLFEGACRILADTGRFHLAWIGLKEEDGAVRIAAGAGPAVSYLQNLRVRWDDTPRGRGPTGRAILEGRTIIIPDFAVESSFEPWRKEALALDLHSSGAFPLSEGGRVVGAITIYVHESGFIGEQEQALLEELAEDLGFALQSMSTEERRLAAEQALKDNEERYRAMVEKLNDIIYITGTDGVISFISPAAVRILGYPIEEIIGVHVLDFVYPPDRSAVEQRVRRLFKGPAEPEEFRLKARDGSARWVLSTSQPIFAGEKVIGIQGVLSDITERKRIEGELDQHRQNLEKLVQDRTADLSAARAAALNLMQDAELQHRETEKALAESKRISAALKESEDSLRRIMETTNEGFWRIDAQALTLDVNQTMCELLGRPREDILGRSIYDFVDSENAAIFQHELARRSQGQSGSYEISLIRPDGSAAICHFSGTSLFDQQKKFDGSFAMVMDITQRKRAEEELKRHAAELEAFNQAMVDRESKIIEMKEEVNRLCGELGRPPAYPPVWDGEPEGKAKS